MVVARRYGSGCRFFFWRLSPDDPYMKKTEQTSRELEIRQLELAIKKTLKSQFLTQETQYKLAEKMAAQKAELLLQKSLAFIERRLRVVKG
jgi:hypothetical protein